MKNVLVTGGAGFIGSNFIHYLLENEKEARVFNFDALTYAGNLDSLADVADDPRYQFIQGNICDAGQVDAAMRENQIDAVVHFAAESHVDRSILGPRQFIETNVVGTFNLLDAARKYWLEEQAFPVENVRFHHVSTDEVFGSLKPGEPAWTEETPYAPNSPYAASKAGSDHLVRSYGHTYGLPYTITNCSNNYGPYQFPEKLIPLCINNIINEKPLPIYGKGENVRDWLYVEDHAKAIDMIFHKGKVGETYNIGGNSEKKNIEVVKTLCKILNKKMGKPDGYYEKLITFVKDRAGHDLRYAIDFSKLKNELGWQPSVTFEEGIEKTIDWYLNNNEWLKNVTSGNYQKYYEEQYIKR